VSHPQILPPLLGDISRPVNEEQIIAQQCEQYEARSSLDTYDIVSGAVTHADEHLGHEEVMSPSSICMRPCAMLGSTTRRY